MPLVGDGITDDTAAFQALLDSIPSNGILRLQSGATYRISGNLIRHGGIRQQVEGYRELGLPATIHYANAGVSNPRQHLTIEPELGPPVTFTGTLLSGVRPSLPAGASLSKRYIVGYGVDPHDANEEHFVGWSDEIGFPAPPQDISGTTHEYYEILTSSDGVHLEHLHFTEDAAAGVDCPCFIYRCRGVLIEDMTGTDTNNLLRIADCEGVVIDGLEGALLNGHATALTLLGVWQTRGLIAKNLRLECEPLATHFFFESWCRGIYLDNLRVYHTRDYIEGEFPDPIIGWTGSSAELVVNFARIKQSLSYNLDTGGQSYNGAAPIFHRYEYTGTVFAHTGDIRFATQVPVASV